MKFMIFIFSSCLLLLSSCKKGGVATGAGTTTGTTTTDPCSASPTAGTICTGGAIFLGTLNPGATSGGAVVNRYMTTPGGCGEIPAGQIVGTGASAYPNAFFTPTCSGTDSLRKSWNDGISSFAVVPGLTDYTATVGFDKGAINTDIDYGSTNTTNIIAVTAAGSGGYHAAARYCSKLNYGGYTDWYLPNRYELNLMFINAASIPGLDRTGSYYWSSTEYGSTAAWAQDFSVGSGYQSQGNKANQCLIRCVRRF